jgi:hypothetical protein
MSLHLEGDFVVTLSSLELANNMSWPMEVGYFSIVLNAIPICFKRL